MHRLSEETVQFRYLTAFRYQACCFRHCTIKRNEASFQKVQSQLMQDHPGRDPVRLCISTQDLQPRGWHHVAGRLSGGGQTLSPSASLHVGSSPNVLRSLTTVIQNVPLAGKISRRLQPRVPSPSRRTSPARPATFRASVGHRRNSPAGRWLGGPYTRRPWTQGTGHSRRC